MFDPLRNMRRARLRAWRMHDTAFDADGDNMIVLLVNELSATNTGRSGTRPSTAFRTYTVEAFNNPECTSVPRHLWAQHCGPPAADIAPA